MSEVVFEDHRLGTLGVEEVQDYPLDVVDERQLEESKFEHLYNNVRQ